MNTSENPLFDRRFLHPRFWGVWLGIAFLYLLGVLPWKVQQVLGHFLGLLFYYLVPSRRRVVRINLDLCFPDMPEEVKRQLIKDSFISTGKGLIEMPGLWFMSEAELAQRYTLHGKEHLDAALERGNALLLGVHFASLESGTCALKVEGYEMQGMYKPARNELFETFMTHSRSSRYAGDLVPNTQMKAFIRKLRKGTLSWYAPDQHFRHNTIVAPLFGVETNCLSVTSKIAQLGKAEVLPFFGIRNAEGTGYDVYVLPPLDNFPSGDEYQDTCRVNKAIEEMIMYAPEQYIWGHKRFKDMPNGPRDPYKRSKG